MPQAIANDFPSLKWFAVTSGPDREPRRAVVVSFLLAQVQLHSLWRNPSCSCRRGARLFALLPCAASPRRRVLLVLVSAVSCRLTRLWWCVVPRWPQATIFMGKVNAIAPIVSNFMLVSESTTFSMQPL